MEGERKFVFGHIWHCHVLEKKTQRARELHKRNDCQICAHIQSHKQSLLVSKTCFFCCHGSQNKNRGLGEIVPLLYAPPNILLRHRILFLTVFCKCVIPELVGFSALQTWPRLELALASKLLNLLMLMQAGGEKKMF